MDPNHQSSCWLCLCVAYPPTHIPMIKFGKFGVRVKQVCKNCLCISQWKYMAHHLVPGNYKSQLKLNMTLCQKRVNFLIVHCFRYKLHTHIAVYYYFRLTIGWTRNLIEVLDDHQPIRHNGQTRTMVSLDHRDSGYLTKEM